MIFMSELGCLTQILSFRGIRYTRARQRLSKRLKHRPRILRRSYNQPVENTRKFEARKSGGRGYIKLGSLHTGCGTPVITSVEIPISRDERRVRLVNGSPLAFLVKAFHRASSK